MTATRPECRPEDLDALLKAGLHGDALALVDAFPSAFSGDVFYRSARQAVEAANPEAALVWLGKAKQAFRDEGLMLTSMRTDLGLINVLDDLARTNESIAVAEGLRQALLELEPSALEPDEAELHAWLSAAAAENLGATLGLAGRHAQAVQAHEQARSLYEDCGSELDLARVKANLGVDLIHVGAAAQGLEVLEAARRYFASVDACELTERCLMYESRALALLGQYGEALSRLSKVLPPSGGDHLATDDTVQYSDTVGPAALRAELSRASVYEALNLFPEALKSCEALGIQFEQRSMLRDLAATRGIQARAVLGERGVAEAISVARECVQLFELVHLPVRAAAERITLARCMGQDGGCDEIDLALAVLTEAGEMRGVVEAALVGADISSTAELRAQYIDQAVAAGALNSPETRWRALWHQSCLAAGTAKQVTLLDDALETLAALQRGLSTDHLRAPFMANRRSPLESRLAVHLEAAELDAAFALSAAHRARALRRAQGRPTPGQSPTQVESGAASLSDQTTLLYQTLGERLVCFIARPSADLELVDLGEVLPDVRELLVALEAKWRHLADPRLRVHIAALRDATEDVLRQLHRLVFAEVDSRLAPGPLTIVPVGCLGAIPFSALHDGSSYLVDRRTVNLAPGVPEGIPGATGQTAKTLVVGIADHRAPLIRTEASQVAELVGGQLLLDSEATADAVREAMAQADVIHLATHSVFRPDNPWLSWLRLADRDVTAAELSTWDLTGKTVVLAACSSGRQAKAGEDEMLGLPRAAFAAGAASVIVSQWAVDDIASVGLMSQLHSGLANGTAADALRNAQLACRDLHPHPYFWAGTLVSVNPLTKVE